MAKLVLKTPTISINAVDLSTWVQEVTLGYKTEEVETTSSGDAAKTRIPGLLEWSVTIKFAQDYAAAAVDATLFPLVGAAPFAVAIRPTSGAKSATNPSYEGNALLVDYPPISGKIGDLVVASAKLTGSGVLSRLVA